MAEGTHDVVVWFGTKDGQRHLFTLTARNADGNKARLEEVEESVEKAKFVVRVRERNLTKQQANARKAVLKAKYIKQGFTYQKRNALPLPMM